MLAENRLQGPVDQRRLSAAGQDLCALKAIETYYEEVKKHVKDPYFIEEIEEIMKDFRAFREEQETHIPD